MRRTPSRHAGESRTNGFTLVELLVVIAIISVLAAMLLPALEHARTTALRTAGMNNHRQMAQGLLNYAVDFDGELPVGVRRGGAAPVYWYGDSGSWWFDFDLMTPVEPYGVLEATFQPVLGSSPVNYPGHESLSAVAAPFHYFVGYRYSPPNDNAATAPTNTARADSRHCFLGDYLQERTSTNYFRAVHVRNGPKVEFYPCNMFFEPPTFDDIIDACFSRYDGSAHFIRAGVLDRAQYTSGRYTYHAQP